MTAEKKPAVITDTYLLRRTMDKMNVIATENHNLRQALNAIANASVQHVDGAVAAAIELAASPLKYTFDDFLPALRVYDSDSPDVALIKSKLDELREKGSVQVGPGSMDRIGLDDIHNAVFVSEEFNQWYQRKRSCRTAKELESIQAEYPALFMRLENEAIEDTARSAVAWDNKQRGVAA